jgi:hypothetical protein
VPAADRRFSPPVTAHDERATRKRGAHWTGGARFGSLDALARRHAARPASGWATATGRCEKNCAHYTRHVSSKTLEKLVFLDGRPGARLAPAPVARDSRRVPFVGVMPAERRFNARHRR